LDCLCQQGDLPDDLLVIHTHADRPETAAALSRLRTDLPEYYPGLSFRTLELTEKGLSRKLRKSLFYFTKNI
jgi:hypothetical protein